MRRGAITLITLGFVGLIPITGCATMIRGTIQSIVIDTDPPGAMVSLSDGRSWITPCTIEAERNKTLQITVEKPGCDTYTTTVMPTLAGAGVALGGLIDYRTGAVYDLQPNPLSIELACRIRPLFPE